LLANDYIKASIDRGRSFIRKAEDDYTWLGQKIQSEDGSEVEIKGQDHSIV